MTALNQKPQQGLIYSTCANLSLHIIIICMHINFKRKISLLADCYFLATFHHNTYNNYNIENKHSRIIY